MHPLGPAAVPGDLDEIIGRCLAKDPDERFPDAHAFARALDLPTQAVSAADGTQALPGMFWQMNTSGDDMRTLDMGTGNSA